MTFIQISIHKYFGERATKEIVGVGCNNVSTIHADKHCGYGITGFIAETVFCPQTFHALWHNLVISNLLNQFITMNDYDIITSHVSYKIGSTFT